jgi:DNA-binding protein H-NS
MQRSLDKMSVRELKRLRARADQLLGKRSKRLADARKKITAIARAVGVSARELLDGRKKGALPQRVTKKAPPPKYVNPANPEETWTGRGRRPFWLKRQMKSGKTAESFLSN